MSEQKEYKTVSQYAALKNARRQRIYQLIEQGVILTEKFGGIEMIDMETYRDFDVSKKTVKEMDYTSITRRLKQVESEVRGLKHRVLKGLETGKE